MKTMSTLSGHNNHPLHHHKWLVDPSSQPKYALIVQMNEAPECVHHAHLFRRAQGKHCDRSICLQCSQHHLVRSHLNHVVVAMMLLGLGVHKCVFRPPHVVFDFDSLYTYTLFAIAHLPPRSFSGRECVCCSRLLCEQRKQSIVTNPDYDSSGTDCSTGGPRQCTRGRASVFFTTTPSL